MSTVPAAPSASQFRHPVAFWLGVVACAVGVGLHLPMYYSARDMGYQMAGMRPDGAMIIGMVLIGAGLVAGLYGLMPAGATAISQRAARIRIKALDDAPLNWRHVALLVAMALAIGVGGLLLPLFFVVSGLSTNIGAIGVSGLPLLLLVCAVAAGGKLGPAYAASRAGGLGRRDAATVTVLVNTRGLTELIALNAGLQAGIIGERLFSILVVMALVMTIATAPLLRLVRAPAAANQRTESRSTEIL
jgi:hypothetical protein